MRRHSALLPLTALLLALSGCTMPGGTPSSPPVASPSPTATGADCPATRPPADGIPFDQALHDELTAMLERDQAGRLGTGQDAEGDGARTARLMEIIAEHGWPTFDLVGEDGEDAAWAIAQHSDLDVDAQRCALAHLRVAVEAGQGSPGNLAYLEDRIHAAAGEAQRYGTQVACTEDGPAPATELIDQDGIDGARASVGLGPYGDYLAEMAVVCAGG